MTGKIELRCSKCPQKRSVDRDEHDPSRAAVVELICPDCDDGDRHSPEFFDADGKWVHPFEDLLGGDA